MKKIITSLILLLSITQNTFAALACSSNGTMIYYVNGVLTSAIGNNEDTKEIERIFSRKDELDEKGKLLFEGIHNPSFGIVNDAAELFAQGLLFKNRKL